MEISIEEISKSFEAHLEIPENKQIIFSGRFGIGKSYFLEKFFEDHNKKFSAVILSPINYSVASNKDVFEYIKYDILFELLKKGIVNTQNDLNKTEKAFSIIQSLNIKAFRSFLKMIPQIGKDLSNILEGLTELKDHLEDFKKQFDQKKQITDYLKSYTEEIGSIYEENFITSLINELLTKLKSKDKKTVLVIGDLDRLDPEHIFRILNIFSVHTDFQSGRFKFDFDKVILVCDIKNIKSIYRHRYGSDVDFEGYMDKFYSHEVFHFRNEENFRLEIKDLITASIDEKSTRDFVITHVDFATEIISAMVISDKLNLRMFEKMEKFKYKLTKQQINSDLSGLNNLEGSKVSIYIVIDYLTQLIGNYELLKKNIEDLNINNPTSKLNIYNQMIGEVIFLLDYKNNELRLGTEMDYEFKTQIDDKSYTLTYKRAHFDSYQNVTVNKIFKNGDNNPIKAEQYPYLFLRLFSELLVLIKRERLFSFKL